MTSAGEERREVAARLRENAGKRGVTLDYLGSTQVASWWLLLHTIDCNSNEQEVAFHMLADLIDPTCHDFGGEEGTNGEGYDFACSACGYVCDLAEPRFCPNCGARVVSDDDQ